MLGIWRAALDQAARDYVLDHREMMIPGYWLIRLRRFAPLIPARTFLSYGEPGNPSNLLDRWPLPLLDGEICGEYADPVDIFAAPERRSLGPMVTPVRLSVERHYQYLVADMRHAMAHRKLDPLAHPRRRVDLRHVEPLY